jgi:hypothetical protein
MSLIGALSKAAKAGEAAKKTAPFYSAVDEALGNLKRPKGTGIEFLTEVLKQPGVKKAEIADRKLEQAFKAKGKITKDEAQQVLADNPPPKLKEKVYDESTAIDEDDLREMVSQEMFGKPYSQIRFGSPQHRKISDEVYKRMDADNGTTYGRYRTPNGENYREILLKLPVQGDDAKKLNEISMTLHGVPYTSLTGDTSDMAKLRLAVKREYKNLYGESGALAEDRAMYRSNHWKEDPNTLAHMRVQDRVGPNGEKILHVEEIQSDWHQAGRKKGYKPEDYVEQSNKLEDQFAQLGERRFLLLKQAEAMPTHGSEFTNLIDEANSITPKLMQLQEQRDKMRNVINYGVPDAPFKKNWHELAMKRLLNYAAENGYDSIAITPGAEQAKRYDLSKQVDELLYKQNPDGTYQLSAQAEGRGNMMGEAIPADKLEDYVGKEVAQKIIDNRGTERNLGGSGSVSQPQDVWGSLSGEGLQVGGEGMKGFYDKMLPDYLNTYGKPYGAQVQMDSVPVSTRDPKFTGWDGGQGDHPFMTSQDLSEPFDGMVELLRRNPETGEQELVGRMLRADSEARIASELMKLDKFNQIKLHNFPITPEMRESIRQKGLPLYQQIGIPTAGAGAASQMLEPEEEAGLAGGGSVAKLAALAKLKKMREEMAPRAEAVKSLIARDENNYLRDVVPNSLTNAEIEAEIKRMAAKAPMIMKPSTLTELKKIVQQEKGGYGSRRLERAADEIPNLERLYKEQALKEAFTGDNARALMTMNPKDFGKYAMPLDSREHYGYESQSEYIDKLAKLVGGFNDVPFLEINKREQGAPKIPFISGHEGRHRSRALESNAEPASLVRLLPRSELREPFARRSQEEYIDALKQELEMTGNKVIPEKYFDNFKQEELKRPPIILPDIYAKGGAVKPQVKKSVSGKVKMTENRDTMFMELSNKKLKRK